MTLMIIAALALWLCQIWLLPATMGLGDVPYLLSSRDNPPSQSQLQQRTSRAATNLQESLLAFVALSILAIIHEKDLTQVAGAWLVLRVIYIPCYLLGVTYVRSIVWTASLACLIYMAVQLV